jgi:hypothetical protein
MTHLNSVLLLHFERKNWILYLSGYISPPPGEAWLLHALAIDASGMVEKALQDFAACSVCVNLPECDTDG